MCVWGWLVTLDWAGPGCLSPAVTLVQPWAVPPQLGTIPFPLSQAPNGLGAALAQGESCFQRQDQLLVWWLGFWGVQGLNWWGCFGLKSSDSHLRIGVLILITKPNIPWQPHLIPVLSETLLFQLLGFSGTGNSGQNLSMTLDCFQSVKSVLNFVNLQNFPCSG